MAPVTDTSISIVDFFDQYNVEHLAAYQQLMSAGIWPDSFLPKNCKFPKMWRFSILLKMTTAYVEFATKGQIHGMPSIDQ